MNENFILMYMKACRPDRINIYNNNILLSLNNPTLIELLGLLNKDICTNNAEHDNQCDE
jgi:hypothetical protein